MGKYKVDVLFLFEKQGREIDSLILLKELLETDGYTVAIIQQNTQLHSSLKDYDPKIVVIPFCYQNRSNNIYFRFWRKASYISLNWEQFFYPGNRVAKTPRGSFATKRVMHCAWSNDYIDLLLKCGVHKSKISLIGCLPLSLLSEKYKDFFRSKQYLSENFQLDPEKKWILFPENFGWAFYKEDMLKQMVSDGQSSSEVNSMREFSEKSFHKIIEWCIKLAENNNLEIILRPRPATTSEEMRRKIESIFGALASRIHIIKDLSVKDWIISSDYVISTYSTTLIEAALAKKNVMMMTPYPIPEILTQIWHPFVSKCESYQQLEDAIFSQGDANYEPLRDWARDNLNLYLDPPEKVCSLIKAVYRSNEKIQKIPISDLISEDSGLLAYLKYWIKQVFWSIKVRVCKDLPPDVKNEYHEDLLALNEAGEKLVRWRKLIHRYPPVVTYKKLSG